LRNAVDNAAILSVDEQIQILVVGEQNQLFHSNLSPGFKTSAALADCPSAINRSTPTHSSAAATQTWPRSDRPIVPGAASHGRPVKTAFTKATSWSPILDRGFRHGDGNGE
jgi:hypothetical protein